MDEKMILQEDFDKCSIKISLSLEIKLILKILKEVDQIIEKDRDRVSIRIYNTYDNIKELNKEIIEEEFRLLDEEDEKCIIIEIYKKYKNSTLSIYSLKKFTESLKSKTIEGLLFSFLEKFKEKQVFFKLLRDNLEFYSKKYIFTKNNKDKFIVDNIISVEKNLIFERNELCNINSKQELNILPDDFYLISRTEEYLDIERIFNSLTILSAIIAISNFSNFTENILEYTIYGYKTIKNKIFLNDYLKNFSVVDSLYSVFKWIYKEKENILERMEISRNIITLYLLDEDILKINNNILSSIKSSYSIYLKKNVDRYIRALKELQDLLSNLENNFYILQDTFSNKFKKNIGTIFAFFFTTILFNVLSNGKIQNIFTKDISILSLTLLFISAIIFLSEVVELNKNIKRLEENYKEKKQYFNFILNKDEIKDIFEDEKFLKKNKEEIQKVKNKYLILFFIINLIIFIALFNLSQWLRDIGYCLYDFIFIRK
ncbi:Uncharacterised protein [Fusobacterium polymorphum]|uniref:Uncharacterized protein n=2 Tax=Fusobacterium nucleatum subsp. polymorphum TaxID=76857 RepID=A5TX62_FUSNP|nr:hypothetical protein [Fusobacterium polymorphum]EDK89487.1 hypothetical protein FNP_1714 [Fusobacterium polymorphum ATCC 10953]WRL69326.1 hypothetical protein VKN78_04355 [Fusobacterium polymorphum]CKH08238.1 Uncharacterised protein [Fusobacterium polymorphum]